MIRRELSKGRAPDTDGELNDYFESLDRDRSEFLNYILTAGLTLEGIIKFFRQRSSNIAFMDQLIERFYDPDTYYGIACGHCEPQSARALILQNARYRGKAVAKIYYERNERIETIEILNNKIELR